MNGSLSMAHVNGFDLRFKRKNTSWKLPSQKVDCLLQGFLTQPAEYDTLNGTLKIDARSAAGHERRHLKSSEPPFVGLSRVGSASVNGRC